MGAIRVTPNTLRNTANELRTLNENFKNEVTAMSENEERLAGMWEGDARNAFHSAIQTDKAKIDVFYAGINKYIERLIETANAYDKVEAENVSIAQTRKA